MLEFVRGGALVALLILASIWDCRERRIPNWLTLLGGALGTVVTLGTYWATGNVDMHLFGMGIAVTTLLLLYLGGGVGGGDVKLAVGVGLLAGYPDIVRYLFYGGLAALAMILGQLAWQGETWETLKDVARQRPHFLKPGAADTEEDPAKVKKRSASFALAWLLAVIWVWVMRNM